MRTLKLIQSGILIVIISLMVGCSDSDMITSSGEQAPKFKSATTTVEEGLPIVKKQGYAVKIRLKPYRSVSFEASAIGYSEINAIDVNEESDPNLDQITLDCRDLFIHGGSQKVDYPIGCHSSGLKLNDVTIENLSSRFITLNVVLKGPILRSVKVTEEE